MAVLTNQTYVDKAEHAIQHLNKNRQGKYYLTMTQIRNLLALTSSLYDDAQSKSFEELADRFAYLRIRFVYQAGRDRNVKDLVDQAEILPALSEIEDKESLIRFTRYMEALVAYFNYYGGKD